MNATPFAGRLLHAELIVARYEQWHEITIGHGRRDHVRGTACQHPSQQQQGETRQGHHSHDDNKNRQREEYPEHKRADNSRQQGLSEQIPRHGGGPEML